MTVFNFKYFMSCSKIFWTTFRKVFKQDQYLKKKYVSLRQHRNAFKITKKNPILVSLLCKITCKCSKVKGQPYEFHTEC